MATYYKISYGTGFAWVQSYVVKVDYPTTNYQALVDILIDYLVEHDKRNILDMQNEYEWDEDGNIILCEEREKEWRYVIHLDEFVQGGNCGDVLMHYGEFDIREISENEIGELVVIEE